MPHRTYPRSRGLTLQRPETALCTAACLLLLVSSVPAQAPLAPIRESGQTVTPVFEGWYRNPDGSFSLSFGYFNRNSREVLELPIGSPNSLMPGGPDRGQPTRFEPRRHWGVFAVTVPPDFGAQARVTWTLVVRGDTFAIPGSLTLGWELDALQGDAGSGNPPPALRFEPGGAVGRGPGGFWAAPRSAVVGRPMALTVWASDDGKTAGSIASDGRAGVPVTLTWFTHQGPPGGVAGFSDPRPTVSPADGKATTSVTFARPGDYVLRVRANDASGVVRGGHAQCCWTNGFVKVRVTP